MSHLIAPSILAADFNQLGAVIEMINRSQADWVHCDVMDGLFVPNISFGMPILQSVKKLSQKPLDVHLMIVDPDRYIDAFKACGADVLTVHIEACTHLDRTLHAIKEAGMKAGVAVNPATPIDGLKHVLPWVDVACLMSVNPGFGGQSFIHYTYEKVRTLKQMIREQGTHTLIEIDGGVSSKNASALLEEGADVLVAGSFVFKSENPEATIANLKGIEADTRIA